MLGVAEKTIYRWVSGRKIPVCRLGNQIRFDRAQLIEWSTANRINVAPNVLLETEDVSGPIPQLAETLDFGGIHYRMSGNAKATVLYGVIQHLRLPEKTDREYLLKMILAREALESTAIGGGIAVPHTRSPVECHLPKPMLALCFLEHPIEYEALDGYPVTALFTLVSPTLKAHLQLLSRLAFALQQPHLKSLVINQGNREELLEGFHRIDVLLKSVPPLNLQHPLGPT